MQRALDKYFDLTKNSTTIGREIIAGLTTFLAMSYIMVVNPLILGDAGMDFEAVFVATCCAAALGSLVMGVLANYPIGLAPGMGQNAFFTYAVVIGSGHPWQTALGAVFLSGVLFLIISLLPIRAWLINSIPKNLKLGMTTGIGFFLAFVAMKNAGIITANASTLIALGDLLSFPTFMALGGFCAITAFASNGYRSAVILGVLLISLISWGAGEADFLGIVAAPPSVAPVFFQLDIRAALDISMLSVILTMLLVDVFDTAGTLVGVATRGNLMDASGNLPRLSKALLADSGSTAIGALLGTSSTTSYIESAAGVESGGRTGLSAVVIAIAFILSLVLAPLAQSIPSYAAAAALLFVSASMAQSLVEIDWPDITESTPAIITALMMPFSFSIADGIGIGFISYVLIKLLAGRVKEVPLAVGFIALVFALKFTFL
ncbi:MAG: NCS2 family permease [Woeseiaceae bacterium]|jgi:AGZA family xanthine/uracil permease-like MFS transporter|nr:NCS2 family permease [Woeseiaceae bacterium]